MRLLDLQQGTDSWSAERRKYDTASEASIMMGASKKASRSDLLKIKSTGFEKEHSEWVEKNLFAPGHEIEAKARPIAEEIVGEELYPAVAVSDDDTLLASFDGITMLEDTIWECKQWNNEKSKAVEAGECPFEDYWQVVQQLAVSGAERCLYMVTDGTEENTVYCWVEPNADDIQRLRDGWAQFNKDLAAYEPPAAEKAVTGSAPSALPALRIELSGAVSESNLDEFRDHAIAVIDGINGDLQTDKDFANAEEAVKWCKTVEQKLSAAKDHALSQTSDIDHLFRTIDEISEQARKKRLDLDKLVKSMKEDRKREIFQAAATELTWHVDALQEELDVLGWNAQMPNANADIAGAMKGKRTIATLRDAADTAVANAKIEADRIAQGIRANLEVLKTEADGQETLFPDGGQLAVSKSEDDLRNTITARIAEHKQREKERAEREAEQKRIREERQAEAETRAPEPKEKASAAKSTTPNHAPQSDKAEHGYDRPDDDRIIEVIATHFHVPYTTARDWIAGMDMIGAEV